MEAVKFSMSHPVGVNGPFQTHPESTQVNNAEFNIPWANGTCHMHAPHIQ